VVVDKVVHASFRVEGGMVPALHHTDTGAGVTNMDIEDGVVSWRPALFF
jgi:hypothetical protein